MELILLILKIILIAFLVMLGLILLLLGIVLLVPIRYEVSGSIGDSWEIKIKGKVTYLLSIIKLLFSYEKEQFDMKIFLFGFEKKLDENDVSEDSSEDVPVERQEIEPEAASSEESEKESEEISEITEPVKKETSIEKTEAVSTETDRPKQAKDKSKNSFDFAFIKQQLTDEHNQSVVKKVWSELLYLLRHFKFRKIVTDLCFATGDPATTGQALGILCMIPVLYQYDFKITPDFEAEEAYIKGTFLVAGKVRLIHVPITLLRLIFDKEVRLVVKKVLTLLEK